MFQRIARMRPGVTDDPSLAGDKGRSHRYKAGAKLPFGLRGCERKELSAVTARRSGAVCTIVRHSLHPSVEVCANALAAVNAPT